MSEDVEDVTGAVVAALVAEDTDVIFALMGDGNVDLLARTATGTDITLVHACHEQGAVAMADGYARFSGRPGVASVTHGPGLSNTATSLLTAAAARSGVVLLAPDTPTGDLDHPQRFDQRGFVGAAGAYFRPLHRPGTVYTDTAAVFRHVRAGRGPAVLNAPTDVMHARLPAGTGSYEPSAAPPSPPPPDPRLVAEAAAALTAARRPAILVGRGVAPGGGAAAVGELADLLAAPIATTLKAKGLLAHHARHLGVAGGLGSGRAGRVLAEADCVLVLGASANQWTTDGGTVLSGGMVVQVDRDGEAIGRHSAADLAVVGDAAATAGALCALIGGTGRPAPDEWTVPDGPDQFVPSAPGTSPVHPRLAVEALDAVLPEDRLLVVDAGHFGSYAQQTLRSWDPRRYAFTHDFGAIGQALGVAIGAAVACPGERVTAVLGDGCLMMSLSELSTVVRYHIPLTLFVMNDGGYGQERHSLTAKGLPDTEAWHAWPDIGDVARGFGIPAHCIRSVRDLDVLQTLPETTGPVLFDVHIDPEPRNPAFAEIAHRLGGAALRQPPST
ncbi:thiamine pyrophosphate-binding protein [Actinomadura citrea]|uniref:Thiamine pyrophosphate-dependent acetolactate synthase large subunit-like protein n=1 Tax=Actinomadura citrea TaxID=46158 RepID=A0A7Y9G636_9ACTN|nr:thiamine pyrophosphate-dependent enzyme [Actinomadura citrea]NYE10677.1 thiamine pyrophosphate-dependent acetolactate synthase large subunit-like protein [Actinomadura citrea]